MTASDDRIRNLHDEGRGATALAESLEAAGFEIVDVPDFVVETLRLLYLRGYVVGPDPARYAVRR